MNKVDITALRAGVKFESIDLLRFKVIVSIEVKEDLVGGTAITTWKILEKWQIKKRSIKYFRYVIS